MSLYTRGNARRSLTDTVVFRDMAVWINIRAAALSGVVPWGTAVAVCELLNYEVSARIIVHLALGALVCSVATLLHLCCPALSPADRSILGSVMQGRESQLLQRLGLLNRVLGSGERVPQT